MNGNMAETSADHNEAKSPKKNDSSLASHHSCEDDEEKQVEMPLLDSPPKTEVKQPKKMPLFKKKSVADDAAGGGGDSSMFDITLDQLKELMEVRGKDLMEKLESSDYNGVKGVVEKLKVDPNKGLDSNNEEDFEQRRAAYGKNEIPPKPMKTFIRLCWDAFHDMLLIILLVCALVSIGLSFYKPPQEGHSDETNIDWIEGVAILVAVLVVVFVTAFNDWRKERQFRGLQDKIEKDQQTSVIRDDHIQQIPVAELVVGDLCFIKYGDLLPADGLIVQSSDLKIDESSITGETDLVKKSEKEDVGLLAGTNVMEGSGRMLVVGVGLNSQVGSIMRLLGAAGDDSEKKKKGKNKDKKDGKKGKKDGKKDKKDEKKKDKKSKPISSTKVSPDKSQPDENESENQTVHTENETKRSTTQHPRIRQLPPLKQSNNDEHEMKPTKKENNNNQQKKKSSSTSESSDDEQKKKPVKDQNNDEQNKKSTKTNDEQQKKKSSSSESSDSGTEKKSNDEKKMKSTKSDKPQKKRSSSSESNHSETEKKPNKSGNSNDEQKTKSTKSDKQPKKRSSSNESSDSETEKESNKRENNNDEQKKKSTKVNDKQPKKRSSSSESNHSETEKKSNKSENNNDEQQKESAKTGNKQQKKRSSPNESDHSEGEKKVNTSGNSNDERKKKPTKTDELQKKKSSSSEVSKDKPEKKSKTTENQNNDQQKKSDSSERSEDEEEKKPDKQKETSTKNKSNDNKSEKKSNKGEDSGEEQEKKSESKKQTKDNNRPTTTSSVKAKVSDGDKKTSEKKKENSQDAKDDPEKKPAGLAALAEEADNDDEKDGSKDSKHKSVLQTKLTKLALYIGYIGMTAAVLTLICLIIRFCITNYVVQGQPGKPADVSYFIAFLIQAITVVVVSVPEGLPLAVTLALAYAVRKMMTDNNLVRHLDACETMGNASTICSDKTGTLTTNRMTVVQCYIAGKYYEKLPKNEEINKDLLPLVFEAVTVNANYTSKIEKAKEDEGGLPKQVGNKTECALLDLVQKWGGSYDEIRKSFPEDKLAKVYTFNSARKMMSTVLQRDDGYRLYTKGASEMVLTKCKSIIEKDNKPKDLNDDEKKKITHDIIEKMANDGLRTICIAYKDLGKDKQNWDDEDKIINDLICIALVGIEDPVRDEVPEAIEKCQKAGVIVRMVTGDNIMTARSIATKCGIIKPEDDFLVLDGKDFNKRIRDSSGKISQKKLDEVWPKLRVLARSSPQDKYNLVNGIVESQVTQDREVVAVTGDGTNDGPALKRADVGFAMGIQGTDVAKQASDIILTDDNFSSIVKAMMWGRNVYDCIAKFLQFQLTANLSAGVISVVSAAAISSVPLRAVQMLWVNLVMDTLASLALATEPPTEDLLNRKPYGRTKSIISPMMMRNILGQSLYQLVIMFIILYTGQYFLGVDSTVQALQTDPYAGREASQQFTLVFNAFVLMTLFNEINSRKLHGERNVFKGIFGNPFFYCIWIFCFIGQILIVTFGDKVFSCIRLSIIQWAWSLLFGVGSLIWQQILLFIPIEPFSKCFSAMYRVCCPCFYKKQKKKDDERRKSDDRKEKKPSSKKSGSDSEEEHRDLPPSKYSTIVHLTNSTAIVAPPPIFAKYMLRKSVDRLNTEFRVINAFRSRLEAVQDQRNEENIAHKRNSRDNLMDE